MAKNAEKVDPKVLAQEVDRRRTFAIISHPDAGKTTLTEKLLLYGGAVQIAGAVKSKRAARSATSDWMAIEKERGISVASSVMQFDHHDHRFNLLDTPGHNDFSEDTYRTLAAADCAVMLVDHAKGVEPQTIKLFKVCRVRGIPIVTFVNKLDREGKAPLDVLSDVEEVLGIPTSPRVWPIGMGQHFKGVYDRQEKKLIHYDPAGSAKKADAESVDLADPHLDELIGEDEANELRGELELLDEAGNAWDEEAFLKGELTPVFFGSAMNSFGVDVFLDQFVDLCPPPAPRRTEGDGDGDGHGEVKGDPVEPTDPRFSAVVFKVQANMDPRHRDRIAFARICSGRFVRGMKARHPRTGKTISLDRSVSFLAQSRQTVEEAWPGDIVGLWDPGVLRIGDTLTEGKDLAFEQLPIFSPEHFVRPVLKDPLKRKAMDKGLAQLSDEGAVQLYVHPDRGNVDPILGAVGWLQIEVVAHRLMAEYGVDVRMDRLKYTCARWIFGEGDDVDAAIRKMLMGQSAWYAHDVEGRPLILFESDWMRQRTEEKYPELTFKAAVQPGRSKRR
jgi:peptide chain release factor 3